MEERDSTLHLTHVAVALCALILLSGCGHSVDAVANEERSRQNPTVMWFSFDTGKTKDAYRMNLTRIENGYELQAPLVTRGNTSARFSLSRTSDEGWFAGPRLTFSF